MNEPSHPDDDCFYLKDKRAEGPSYVGNEELTEWEAFFGSEEVAMNEPSDLDDDFFYLKDKRAEGPSYVGNEELTEWEAFFGSEEVAMSEPSDLDDVISSHRFLSATFNTAEPSRKKLHSGAKPSRHAVAPSITSFLRLPRPHFCRMFDYPQALGGHHNAHKHERAAQQNSPATDQQQYHPLALFPADQHQQHTSSIPFPHSPGMDHTVGTVVFVNVLQVPIQPQQHLLSSSVPHQSFLGVSTNPDALSPTTDVDDLSADIDLTLRL
ncbi:hypothetical protein SLEP1_g41787 [Rubroshorea leprosula]|uniref:Uncharacterized protein n=1 Tax=Rubroshorea leprosula TaxID=152421 RepID=A0AAV5L7Q4_9ROSI|nr:hypothetical protein SLEP1_g41787 [Rubroshorea leprosula]